MIKICEIKVPLSFTEADIKNAICDYLLIKNDQFLRYKILRKSIDARRKNNICYRCNFAVELKGPYRGPAKVDNYVEPAPRARKNLNLQAVVVGSGPAGLFCALELLKSHAKVVILERGKKIEERVPIAEKLLNGGEVDPECNIQFGEGGAGTFSDGKLNTGINNPLVQEVLQTFQECGAGEEILYDSHPHIGTDILRNVVVNLRNLIIKLGGEFVFDAKFTDFEQKNAKMQIKYQKNGQIYKIEADKLILALGYSARDTHTAMFNHGLKYAQKAFSVGYRIEHLQSEINQMEYGEFAPLLPPAPYKFFAHVGDRTIYTFCNCPGGVVVPAMSQNGEIVVNGMSYNARDGKNANSALLVSVSPEDFGDSHPLAGINFQKRLESEAYKKGQGRFVVSRVDDFLHNRRTTKLGAVEPTIKNYVLGKVDDLLPENLVKDLQEGLRQIGKKHPIFIDPDAILTGIETRSSAPFMVYRDDNLMTNIENVYSIGEGAGRAGGIVSAAVDGMKIAIKIAENEGTNGSN